MPLKTSSILFKKTKMLLEICTNSYQSVKNAKDAGIKRIELCSELSIGGITPSYGLIKKVLQIPNITTYILIRPRSGNFCYTNEEFSIMKKDIEICKELGCHGIVSGILNPDETIDTERTRDLLNLSKPLSFTFHRAFDIIPNPEEGLKQLINLGADRVLTSGQHPKAINGLETLKKLKQQSENRITILVGGSVSSENAKQFRDAGFDEIHSSASKILTNEASEYFGKALQTVSNPTEIKAILKAIHDEV